MKLYDAHNHLHDGRLASILDQILSELALIPLGGCVVNGTSEKNWSKVYSLSTEYSWIRPAYGYHPWNLIDASPDWLIQLTERLQVPGSSVGEIGLDRWKEVSNIQTQKKFFIEQLALAATRNVPVSIHCLRAWEEMLHCLKNYPLPACGFLLHSFGGPEEMIKPLVALGGYFSFPGYYLTERKGQSRELFKSIPIERILLETDSPDQCLPIELDTYQLKNPDSGKRLNHPGNITSVYEGFAKFFGIGIEEIASVIEENFTRLFGE